MTFRIMKEFKVQASSNTNVQPRRLTGFTFHTSIKYKRNSLFFFINFYQTILFFIIYNLLTINILLNIPFYSASK
jgi:hypothetical protein